MLPAWRTTPWPIACALGGAALVFAADKLDPDIPRNARRNAALSSALDKIIGHKEPFAQGVDQIALALGDDALDFTVVGSGFIAGAFPRLSRMSCGTAKMYAEESCRLIFEKEPTDLSRLTPMTRGSSSLASTQEEWRAWAAGLNERGMRASLEFSENGRPWLKPPELPPMPEKFQPQSSDINWWRNPAHPNWKLLQESENKEVSDKICW
jgi:hypothetical protein